MIKKKTLNLVQLLRGIASLLVVLMHTTIAAKEFWSINFLGGIFTFGGAGVDIFFVLSGFIITYTSRHALKKSSSFLTFLKRRFIRIFPVYWIIISGFLSVQILLPAYYNSHFNLSIMNVANTYFLLPNHQMLNSVSWTLTYELFFYILFSVAFLIKSSRFLFVASLLYILFIIVSPFILDPKIYDNKWINVILYPMNIEFFLGIAVALLIPQIKLNFAKPLLILGSILFIIAALSSNAGYYIFNNGFDRVILFGLPSFCILLAVVRLELTKDFHLHNFLLYLGEASYSLYLIHLPIIVAAIKLLSTLQIGNSITLQMVAIFLIIAICFASIVFYKKIENPLIIFLNNTGNKKIPEKNTKV